MSLRSGITTGTCAAAAAKAAAMVLAGGTTPAAVEVGLPSGEVIRVPVVGVHRGAADVTAVVRKDAGDDPDVTNGLEICTTVAWAAGDGVALDAGEGVGTVTKPGLQVPPGEPAINPVPRRMIVAAVREITSRGVRVTIAIPGGREIAQRTFNPRLGIEGGLSILGTSGIVRPYSTSALRDALKCSLDVARACGAAAPVFVPGNIGARAARLHFMLRDEQVIEVGNEWGYMLDEVPAYRPDALMVLGHPGKLAKLAEGQWDTHSARSGSAAEAVARLHEEMFGRPAPESPTAEGIFASLPTEEGTALGVALARRVRAAVAGRIQDSSRVAVFLINMAGQCLGTEGDFSWWK